MMGPVLVAATALLTFLGLVLGSLISGVRPTEYQLARHPLLRKFFSEIDKRRLQVIVITVIVWALAGISGGLQVVQPTINGVQPNPDESEDREFDILVAKFNRIDRTGKSMLWEESTSIFRAIKDRIDSEEEISKKVSLKQSDPVYGETASDRSNAAARLSEEYSADLVIYGTLREQGSATMFIPEFYIPALEGAEELIGANRFGEPVPCKIAPTDLACTIGTTEELQSRTDALTRFTLGLAYLSLANQRLAVEWLNTAAQVEGWEQEEGKEIIYLFLGTAYTVGKHSDLPLARTAYKKATELDPEYARAYIGLGNVYYREFEQSVSSGTPDIGLLDTATVEYHKALHARNKPDTAYVDAKVHVGLGNIDLILAQVGQCEKFDSSWKHYRQVINDYRDDKKAMGILAHAYLGIGTIYEVWSRDYIQAAIYYREAIVSSAYDDQFLEVANVRLTSVESKRNGKIPAESHFIECTG